MTLAIPDTEMTPLNIQKIQAGDPSHFQKLYRKFYDILVDETTLLLKNRDQALALVQLSCIQTWIQCEGLTSEQYYFAYAKLRVRSYAQALSRQEDRIKQELEVLKEILSDKYALGKERLASLYEDLTPLQKELVRQVFKSYYRQPGNAPVVKHPLLRYAYYALHYILG